MDTGRISARYAKALYEYAADRKKEKEVYEQMKFISEVLFLTPALTKALDNPRISSEKKKELLLAAAGANPPFEFVRFIDLIIERKRESYLHFMSLVYQDIYRKMKGIVSLKRGMKQHTYYGDHIIIIVIEICSLKRHIIFVYQYNHFLIIVRFQTLG
jgi:F0F1-type ATP synthase delta subunit